MWRSILFGLMSFVQQDPAIRQDVYAVYSASLSSLRQGPAAGEVFYIEETTVPISTIGGSMPRDACYPITPTNQVDWNEALTALRQSAFTPETLERQFQIKTPYVLLDDKGVGVFRAQQPQNERVRGSYIGARRLFRFSGVFFNQKRTLALFQISMFCGNTCGEGGWRVFEKVNGQWLPFATLDISRPTCPDWVA